MKKLIVLFSVVLFCFSSIARDLGASWVVTNEGKIDCKRINLSSKKAHVVFENGNRKAIAINTVTSYSKDGKVFTRLPLYKDGKPTGEMVFMELIKNYYNLSLYKYEYCNTNMWDKANCYFLYNGDKLHLALDEKSLPNICNHLGFTVRYK